MESTTLILQAQNGSVTSRLGDACAIIIKMYAHSFTVRVYAWIQARVYALVCVQNKSSCTMWHLLFQLVSWSFQLVWHWWPYMPDCLPETNWVSIPHVLLSCQVFFMLHVLNMYKVMSTKVPTEIRITIALTEVWLNMILVAKLDTIT